MDMGTIDLLLYGLCYIVAVVVMVHLYIIELISISSIVVCRILSR